MKCGKQCFPTVTTAYNAMRKVSAKDGKFPQRVYRCHRCRAFHYTSKPKTYRKR